MQTVNLPKRVGYTIRELARLWEVSADDLHEWIGQGELYAHVWLPLMSVFHLQEFVEGAAVCLSRQLCHWEGHVPISRHLAHRLFKFGSILIRDFLSIEGERYQLPETALDIMIHRDDLIVLHEERRRFEKAHGIPPSADSQSMGLQRSANQSAIGSSGYFDPTFKMVTWEGKVHYFGDMQAAILRLLYEAGRNGQPWQSGKRLLQQAGSQSFKLSNVFSRNPVWRQLIHSNRGGLYRLDSDFLASAQQKFQ